VYDEAQFTETAQFELHEGSTQTETLHFKVLLPVTNLSRKICTYKTGMCVHTGVEPMGNFEPREEPYELTYKPNPVPSGWHVRGAYKLVTEFICDEGLCCPKMTANMTIVKQK